MQVGRVAVAALICGASVLAIAGAEASTLVGTKVGNLLAGTTGADKLIGRAGADTLKGRAGDDLLNGGRGADTLIGGPGADRIVGGPGNDVIQASDGRADRLVDGGGGVNTCVVDIPVDLSAMLNCGAVQAGSALGGGGAGGGGTGGGGNLSGLLNVTSAQGLTCLPLGLGCLFTVTGNGADALAGNVTAGGAVTSVANAAVNGVVTGTWLASGTYQCGGTGNGFLVVHMGAKSTPQIPVNCG
jgi:hemolysin type calcium-binding protein